MPSLSIICVLERLAGRETQLSTELSKPLVAIWRGFNPQFASKGDTTNFAATNRRENILFIQTIESSLYAIRGS